MSGHRVSFPQLGRDIELRDGETLFQGARRHGLRIVGACGGRGSCGSCLVRVQAGEMVRNDDAACDEDGAPPAPGSRKWMRACKLSPSSDCTIEVAPRSLAAVARAETDQGAPEVLPLDAAVQAFDLALPQATLQDNLSDLDRVWRGMGAAGGTIDLEAARQLPGVLRADAAWALRVFMRGAELIGCAPRASRMLGLAVDLGTTNAAGFLVDLETGARIASLGVENPQVAWGADLISRLNFAVTEADGAAELRAAAVAAVNGLAQALCASVGCPSSAIVDVAICGNTAMHHLLLGLPVRQLGRAPFVAATRDAMELKARDLGFDAAPGAWVQMAPNVGGFVGGDHVTALLATEDEWSACGAAVVMDIGTNTEISVVSGGRLLTASAPSGPALEGGHVSCGMRAADGAIEKVRLDQGRIKVETIGGRKPVGLCGSGVLDTVAALHRGGLMSDQGRLAGSHADIVVSATGGRRAARLAEDVLFTQDDVRAVQLAKAAIRTATELLLEEAGLVDGDVERFIIAGSFGAYIDVASGVDIGLFPALPAQRFRQVGNAAGVGVRRMLASRAARERARDLAAACRYVELSSRSDFQKVFLRNIGFPRNQT